MTQSSGKRDTKSKSHRGMKLAPVRVFSCKRTPPKIEQVALSARLRGEDRVMLSCFNSITSFRKTREVLPD